MAKHNRTGKWGEQIATDLLVKKGCSIVETNWRLGHYEIDIVAMRSNRLVFVEVKTRSNIEDDPVLAVDKRKQRKMVIAADNYVRINNLHHEVMFDIVAINGNPDNYTVEHIEDAFLPPLSRW